MVELYVGEVFKSGGKHFRVLAFEKFNPDQPRDSFEVGPADEPRDAKGRWTVGGDLGDDFEKANPYHDKLGRFASKGAEFIRSHYRETADFVHGKPAKQILIEVVKHHKVQSTAKDLFALGISSLLTFLSKEQFNSPHTDEFIQHTVQNLKTHLDLTTDKTKVVLKDSVKALMDARKRGKKEIEKAEDPVLEVLTMLSEMLDKGDDNEPQS